MGRELGHHSRLRRTITSRLNPGVATGLALTVALGVVERWLTLITQLGATWLVVVLALVVAVVGYLRRPTAGFQSSSWRCS